MIAFDNGPARGDYVRYIEDLMARAALAAPAVVASDGDMASDVDALIRERSAASNGPGANGEWTPTAPNAMRRTRPPVASSSGFTAPAVASPAAAAASAIASALMSGQVGRRAMSAATAIALAAVVGGIVLVLVGVLWQPFNFAIVVGGVALLSWAVRRLKAGAIGQTRSA